MDVYTDPDRSVRLRNGGIEMLKTRTWIIILAAVCVLMIALSVLILTSRTSGVTAQVVLDGEVIREIDLSRIREPYSFTVEDGSGGVNRIEVEPGRIRVSEANCPDKICVSQGWLSDQTVPVVCLPHRLIIRIKS